MSTFRRTLALSALLVVAPAATVLAADVDEVRTLATEAADLVAAEQNLLVAGDSEALLAADARGHEILAELDAREVELTQAIRDSLALLADPVEPTRLAPPAEVYAAAATDLGRIADTPEAVLPTGRSTSNELYLVGVAALALLAFAAALSRREQDADDVWDDAVTGLADRRQLDRDLATLGATPTAVMMIDVDGLATVNDRHGRRTGDEVLRRVGEIVSANVRLGDVVYRSGGSEFCVLLPGADLADARSVADRVLGVAAELRHEQAPAVSVSIGLAADRGSGVADTLLEAGEALGLAQHAGGGRVATSDTRQTV